MTHLTHYKRILLKLSGETLIGNQAFGIDPSACRDLALALRGIHTEGIELGIVIGGGNIFRGVNLKGVARTPADQMGMLATLMNGLALQQALIELGISVSLMSALECPRVAESFSWQKANELLAKGTIVIFVGGTGSPYFTTDTTAALRASEIGANIILKATKVNGVYTKDPHKYPDAKRYETISYSQMLSEKLAVMDATAIALCMSSKIPLFVFNMERLYSHSIAEILNDKHNGTTVSEE